ncbi:MAG: DUF4332 domain-containing protein [Bacillota bacterium]
MNTIAEKLTQLKGIGKKAEQRLKEKNIENLIDLRTKTLTAEQRQNLAEEVKVSGKTVYLWAKEADLMRVEGIDSEWAELLVRAGVRNLEDLAEVKAVELKKVLDVYSKNYHAEYEEGPALEQIKTWKAEAAQLENTLQLDPDDPRLEVIFKDKLDIDKKIDFKEGSFFDDLSSIITNIGKGIAEAQVELDKSSIEIQKKIDEDEEVAGYGLQATWYVMPETTFTLKMEYTMVEEKESKGSGLPLKKLFISPMNAKYQNYFKSTSTTESEFKFKIVPVPPPTQEE